MTIPPWLKTYVEQRIQTVVRWSILSTTSPDGRDQIRGRGRRPEEPDYSHPVLKAQHYGFRSRPGPGAVVYGLAVGSAAQRTYVASEMPGEGPDDQEEWEVELYAKFGQRIILSEDGRLTLLTGHNNRVELMEDGSIVLTSKGGATLTMDPSGKVSTHDELFKSTHFGGAGGTPTLALAVGGGALGTGGSIATALAGTDSAFKFTLLADPMTTGGPGDLATITFAKKFGQAPHGVTITPITSACGVAPAAGSWYWSATDTALTIKTGANLPPTQQYGFSVTIVE